MALRPVTLGILGNAEVAGNLIVDTLNAHFALGAEDHEGYFAPSDRYELHALIPAGETVTSQGIHAFWEWVVRCELPYQVLFDETMNERTDDILGNVENPEDDIYINCVDPDLGMVGKLAKAENPMLLVLSNEGQFLDGVTADAAAAALREGIPVHDLSRMLLEITWQHLPDHEPPAEAAMEVEPDGQMALVVSDAPDVTLTAGEVAAVNRTLELAETFVDRLFGELVNEAATLRQSLIHGRSLLAPRPETPAESQGEEPKKTRLEIFNPESGKWEPAGRGRPPKTAQTRRVPA
ncbi:hypothetical protein [Streptomyces sp. NBC_01451]|uniref:hypothetical protein n=1 Tax=Streptomyces sp. NBC_01451 TaxID=2903872 RepID=UPI002E369824|nr:hypothetical protein [Streptomyces sp. NBC_01451]